MTHTIRKLAAAFILALLAPLAFAQGAFAPAMFTPFKKGGGSITSGSSIAPCTSSILYADAGSLLKCDPAAVVNGSVSTAGRSILTIKDTVASGQSMFDLTGTLNGTLSAETSGATISITGDNDNQLQSGLKVSIVGANTSLTNLSAAIKGSFSGSANGTAGWFISAPSNASTNYALIGQIQGSGGQSSAGVVGWSENTSGNFSNHGGVFSGGGGGANPTRAYGVTAMADSDAASGAIGGYFYLAAASLGPSSSIPTPSGTAALVSDNGAVAANIFEARDNGSAVFTIADSGALSTGGSSTANFANIYAISPSSGLLVGYSGGAYSFDSAGSVTPASSGDTFIRRDSAATVQLGTDVNGAAINQTLKAHDGITGTDIKGASLTLSPGLGTGAAVSNPLTLNRVVTKATGTTAQTYSPAIIACPTKILSNTSATAQTIATITTTSTTGGSVTMDYTTVANNGTLQDTDSGMVKVSWNNNAGTVAAAMTAVAMQSDSDASGTLATTPTATVATNVISIKFTPTWVTIVPTTVTGWALFHLATSGDTVACQ